MCVFFALGEVQLSLSKSNIFKNMDEYEEEAFKIVDEAIQLAVKKLGAENRFVLVSSLLSRLYVHSFTRLQHHCTSTVCFYYTTVLH